MRIVSVIFLFVASIVPAATVQAQNARAADEAAIKRILTEPGRSAHTAADLDWENAFGVRRRGLEETIKYLEERVAPTTTTAVDTTLEIRVMFVTDDVAVADQYWSLTGQTDGPGGKTLPDRQGRDTYVFQRRAGQWRMVVQRIADLRQQSPKPSAAPASLIREQGLVANFYQPSGSGKHPAIVVVSGSDGGIELADRWGRPLAAEGFAVLTLAYFGMEGLPPLLEQIPLEYFKTAIDWVRAHPAVDPARVGFAGFSRGGEAALLIGATYPEVRAIVAGVPSHVASAAIHPNDFAKTSAWTLGGKPVPFVPYDTSQPFTSLLDLYVRGLQNEVAVEAAAIAVERINGPILLISSGDDKVWPSSTMADQVLRRLQRNRFAFPVEHLNYDKAGHAISGPPRSSSLSPSAARALRDMGGTEEENARARADAWAKTVTFLKRALGVAARGN